MAYKYSIQLCASVTTSQSYVDLIALMNEKAADLGTKVLVTLCQVDRSSVAVGDYSKYKIQFGATVQTTDSYAELAQKIDTFAKALGDAVVVTLVNANQWVNQATMEPQSFDATTGAQSFDTVVEPPAFEG